MASALSEQKYNRELSITSLEFQQYVVGIVNSIVSTEPGIDYSRCLLPAYEKWKKIIKSLSFTDVPITNINTILPSFSVEGTSTFDCTLRPFPPQMSFLLRFNFFWWISWPIRLKCQLEFQCTNEILKAKSIYDFAQSKVMDEFFQEIESVQQQLIGTIEQRQKVDKK